MKEPKEQIEEIISWTANQIKSDPDKFGLVEEVMKRLIGDASCLTCPGGIQAAIDYLKAYYNKSLNKSISMKSNCNFEIKNNGVLYSTRNHAHYNNQSLTDEIAIDMILSNPNQKVNFSKLPPNLEELLAAAAKKKAKGSEGSSSEASAPKDEAAQREAMVKELNAFTKAQLQEDCKKAGRPEEEYIKLNKADLITLMVDGAMKALASKGSEGSSSVNS